MCSSHRECDVCVCVSIEPYFVQFTHAYRNSSGWKWWFWSNENDMGREWEGEFVWHSHHINSICSMCDSMGLNYQKHFDRNRDFVIESSSIAVHITPWATQQAIYYMYTETMNMTTMTTTAPTTANARTITMGDWASERVSGFIFLLPYLLLLHLHNLTLKRCSGEGEGAGGGVAIDANRLGKKRQKRQNEQRK